MDTIKDKILKQMQIDLEYICSVQPDRHPGSPGNRQATAYMAKRMKDAKLEIDTPEFPCMDWIPLNTYCKVVLA